MVKKQKQELVTQEEWLTLLPVICFFVTMMIDLKDLKG